MAEPLLSCRDDLLSRNGKVIQDYLPKREGASQEARQIQAPQRGKNTEEACCQDNVKFDESFIDLIFRPIPAFYTIINEFFDIL